MCAKLLGLAPRAPTIITPPAPPPLQDAKTPSASSTLNTIQQEQSGMSGGIANTLLTGPAGVTEDQLKLGRKTLLGG